MYKQAKCMYVFNEQSECIPMNDAAVRLSFFCPPVYGESVK